MEHVIQSIVCASAKAFNRKPFTGLPVSARHGLRLLGLVLCLAPIPLTGCSSGRQSTGSDGTAPATSAEPGESEPKASSLELARIYLASGKEARFVEIQAAEDRGILYLETGPHSETPTFAEQVELDALEMFLRLSPGDAPIPRALVEVADASSAARIGSRQLVPALSAPLFAPAAISGLRTLSEDHEAGNWSCNQDADDFEDFACDGTPIDIEYCDSGQWFNLSRSTAGSKRKKSLGIVVACGTDVLVRHYYADCCNWHKLAELILPDAHWLWSRYTGLAKWERRVKYDRVSQPSGSYLRAYTAFYN